MKKQLLNGKLLPSFFLFLLITISTYAQQWKPLGPDPDDGISTTGNPGTIFTSDSDGAQYVCYPNLSPEAANKKVIVKKLVNGKWMLIGSFKSEDEYPSMVIDGKKIYVAYTDFSRSRKMTLQVFDQQWNEFLDDRIPIGVNPTLKVVKGIIVAALIDPNNVPFLMRFNGSSWTRLAPLGINSNYSRFAFELDGNGNYWIAYTVPGDPYIRLKRDFLNTWMEVPASGRYSSANITELTLKTDKSGIPYLLYKSDLNPTANIVRFNFSSYTLINPPTTEESNTYSINFSADNTLHVAFNAIYGDYITVRKLTGNTWSTVGNTTFSQGSVTTTNLSFDSNIPYVFYLDDTGTPNIARFNGNHWEHLLAPAITEGQPLPTLLDIAVAPTGIPYLSYRNFNHNNKLAALTWNGSTWQNIGNDISDGDILSQSLTTGQNGQPIIAYIGATDRLPRIKKHEGPGWTPLAVSTNSSAAQIKIAGNESGELFLATLQANLLQVSKFDGSSFQPFASQLPFAGNELYKLEQILITKAGNPILVALDNDMALPQLFRYENGEWIKMNLPAIFADSETGNYSCKAAIGTDDRIYLAYSDGANLSTLAYDGRQWSDLGWSNPQYGSNPTIHVQGNTPYLTFTNLNTQLTTTLVLKNGNWSDFSNTLFEGENNTLKTVFAANQIFAAYDNSGSYVKALPLPLSDKAPEIAAIADISTNVYRKPITLTAPVSTSTGTFVYTSNDMHVAATDGNKVLIKGKGTAIITATQQASPGFTEGKVTFKITVAEQAFSFTQMPDAIYGDTPYQLVVTGTPGATFTYHTSDAAVSPVDAGGKITLASAGTSNITITQIENSTYFANSQQLTVNVAKRNLFVRAANEVAKIYDGSPAAVVQVIEPTTADGLIANDAISISLSNPVYSDLNVGTDIPVTYSQLLIDGEDKANYNVIDQLSIRGSIEQKQITAAAKPYNRAYNQTNNANPVFSPFTADQGIVSGDELGITYKSATFSDPNAAANKPVAFVDLHLTGRSARNYQLAPFRFTAEILRLSVKVRPNDLTKTYGAQDPELSFTVNPALLPGDGFTGQLSRQTGENTGVYTISRGSLSAGQNYDVSSYGGTLTINKAELTIKANDQIKVAGQENPVLTGTITGFVNGEDQTVIQDAVTYKTIATALSPAGTYTIKPGGGAAKNYRLNYQPGILTVIPAPVTAITSLQLAKNSLFENTAEGAIGGILSSISGDPTDIFTYSLSSGEGDQDNAHFTISGNQLITRKVLDFEQQSVFMIRIKATSSRGAELEQPFRINLTDVNEAPTLNDISNQNLCTTTAQQTVPLKGISAGPEDYQSASVAVFSDNNNLFESLSANETGSNGTVTYQLKASATGTAKVTVVVTDNGGTDNGGIDRITKTFLITANSIPEGILSSDKGTSVSKGETVQLTAEGGTSYTWSDNKGLIADQHSNQLTLRPASTSTYTVLITNATGCSITRSITIQVNEDYPNVTALNLAVNRLYENAASGTSAGTMSSISGDPSDTFSYSLNSGEGDQDNAHFTISGNQLIIQRALDFEQQSVFMVRIKTTSSRGAELDQMFRINLTDVNEAPTLNDISNQALCSTTTPQTVPLKGISAGPEDYQSASVAVFSDNDSLFESLSANETGSNGAITYRLRAGVTGTAKITVVVTDNGGTDNGGIDRIIKTFLITANSIPAGSLSSNKGTSVSKGETIQLSAEGGISYTWSDSKGLIANQNSDQLTLRPAATTTYTVLITNATGCSITRSITIQVNEDYLNVKAMNILTPNGDGINDLWIVENIDQYPENMVRVFDKGGRTVFTTTSYNNNWNGHFGGNPLAEGTYYYIIDFGTGKPKMKGFITILQQSN